MWRLSAILVFAASPALAADKPFFSLANTDFIVWIGFLLFVGILIYFKVPGMLSGMLDKRAEGIRFDLEEARSLREEAQSLLASFERKSAEVQEQADRIVAAAKSDAEEAAEQARKDLDASIGRRIQAAEDQIASAESAALRSVRDRAISAAVAAAGEVLARDMDAARSEALFDDALARVKAKLH
ncbi:MAG: F0F1 ATP synthase subunit B [Paracoccaceae bacterium]|nr:F0F1 ATP synthase subunit B [Paracoccaceae bacterium]